MGISETHAVPFFETYHGRIERDSAPLGSISTSIAPHLILAAIPMPKKRWKIQGGPTKEAAYWDPNRRSSASIPRVGRQKGNIKSCIDTPRGFFREMEPFQSRRHHFGGMSNLEFWADVDDSRRLCIRTQ